jgi:hypothetical protein
VADLLYGGGDNPILHAKNLRFEVGAHQPTITGVVTEASKIASYNIGHGFVECAVCCLARNTYLIRAVLTPQLTPLLSMLILPVWLVTGRALFLFIVFALSRGF